jgi:glycosyltransferase involved in cell wall biosynthesis
VISVVTPVYNTPPEILARTWASLKAQTHTDWEWVIWDDSRDDSTWRHIYGLAADERYRIQAHRSHVHSGIIGEVKRRAFMVATGDILVELDHDDELTPDCLATIQDAFDNNDIGFAYSDWCELFADGTSGRYPTGWAFGYGSDYWSEEHGCWVMSAPPLNGATVRHIVSMPNHVRAWRADAYRHLGGHDPSLPVADDYDLCVRTVLAYESLHIPKMLYKQHIGSHTAQRQRNGLIQSLVAELAVKYESEIHSKFGEGTPA